MLYSSDKKNANMKHKFRLSLFSNSQFHQITSKFLWLPATILLQVKNQITEHWICSKYQAHNCRASFITENNDLIETRGKHNQRQNISDKTSAAKPDTRNVIKHLTDLSERFTPFISVASAAAPVTNDLAFQFVLPTKNKLIQTAARTPKQLDVNMSPIPFAQSFKITDFFGSFICCNSGSNGPEQIFLCENPERLKNLEKLSFWLDDGTFEILPKTSHQLYSSLVNLSGTAPACKYVFIPNKNEKKLQEMLRQKLFRTENKY